MKVRAGVTLSTGRGREERDRLRREEERGAPSPQAPAFAGKAESFRIREQGEDKLEQTSSFYLIFYTPDKNPGDNLILSNLISKEPGDALLLPLALSAAHKAPREPPASAEARARPLPDSPAARANPPGLGEERREQNPPPPLRPLFVDTSNAPIGAPVPRVPAFERPIRPGYCPASHFSLPPSRSGHRSANAGQVNTPLL